MLGASHPLSVFAPRRLPQRLAASGVIPKYPSAMRERVRLSWDLSAVCTAATPVSARGPGRARATAPCPHSPGAPSARPGARGDEATRRRQDRKSTRLNSSHVEISYAVFCLKKKNKNKLDTHSEQDSTS